MCSDKNEDDESGGSQGDQGDQGGHGTPPTYTPTNRPRQKQTDTPRPRTDTPRIDAPALEPKSDSTRVAEGYKPSIKELKKVRFFKKNGKRYTLGYFGLKWFVFENGKYVEQFDKIEHAEKYLEALLEEESPSSGPKM